MEKIRFARIEISRSRKQLQERNLSKVIPITSTRSTEVFVFTFPAIFRFLAITFFCRLKPENTL